MSSDDDPSTGNASTGLSASSSASWNPALRPNGHARNISTASNDDFFDRYPGPTPEKSRPQPQEPLAEVVEDTEAQSPSRNRGTKSNREVEDTSASTNLEVNPADSEVQFDLESPASPPWSVENDDGQAYVRERDLETAVFQPHESAQQQALHLETQAATFIGTPGLETPIDLEKELAEQSVAYEHQGELADVEEAVDEAPDVPLLDDEEPPPTVETIHQAPAMRSVSGESASGFDEVPELGQTLPKSNPQPGHIDRSFTTNFTELPAAEEASVEDTDEPKIPISPKWPSAGDDKTFGELLGDSEMVAGQTEDLIPQKAQVDDGWGAAAGDDAFGELLDNQASHAPSASVPVAQPEETAAVDAPVPASESKDEDLAAMWQAALDDDDLLEESNDLDPSKFFGDDDPGFLEDELSEPAPTPVTQPANERQKATSSYVPATPAQPAQLSPYAPSGPQMLGQSHGRSAGTPSTGLFDVYGHGGLPPQAQQPQRPGMQSAMSFVDKAKTGYQSPYDLPMDVVKPKQRPRPAPTVSQVGAVPTPPPRTSSMSSLPSQPAQPPTSSISATLTPPSSRAGPLPTAPPTAQSEGNTSAKPTPQSNSGFFEDLPVAPKARSRPSGAYTPQIPATPTSQLPPQGPGRGSVAPPVRPPVTPAQQQPASFAGLTRQPERLPLLPDQPTAPVSQSQQSIPPPNQRYSPSSLPAPTSTQSRFSPAPPPQGAPAPAASRYSPAPAAQGGQGKKYSISGPSAPAPPGIQHAHPFAPRTSSPLAFQTDKLQAGLLESPPKINGTQSAGTTSPERPAGLSYSPIDQRTPSSTTLTSPPQRPMTQSPPVVRQTSRYATQHADMGASAAPAAQTRSAHLPHRRQFSMDLAFAPPNDERVHDPLQRWKGHPIFKWGDSGSIISSFPKHTPFYGAGGSPSLKCTPGAVSVSQASTFMPMEDRDAKFPGPLAARAKGKKKEVLSWMSGKIDDLEKRAEVVRMDFQIDLDIKKRTDEKVILWRLMKVFVEHDGRMEGDKKIEDEIRQILLPDLAQMGQVTELQSPISTGPSLQADAIDKSVVLQLRQALLQGEREKAVWLAEENKLWGHAMLIASTLGPDVWKQIVQSFVRSQVKTIGSDARSLAALYQVFAGNSEECMDELVPPSARAGFQMMSKSDVGAIARDPLEGLDQWRETLGLVAGNRTPADGASLVSLGRLLSDYGRAEAAHSCFLFARQQAKHTGADDAEASFVLLGADHKTKTESFANNQDAIILTEIYEWASSLSAPSSAVHYIPHLQSFKLIHAHDLAASGLKSKAQSYCDHITSAYTSTTRPSPYYHPTFTQSVNDLSAFLSQTPQSGEGGRLSKLAMNKVSSGAASWFTKFVSGDDDQDSNASGQGAGSDDMMNGPFGRVNGDSPDLSRNPSVTNLYNPAMSSGASYAGGQMYGSTPPQSFAPSSGPGKYAPMAGASKYAPMAPGVMNATAQRPESPRRPASTSNYAPASTNSLGVSRPDAPRSVSEYVMPYGSDSRRNSAQYPGSQGSYEPQPALAEDTPSFGYQPVIPEHPAPTEEIHDVPADATPAQESYSPYIGNDSYQPPATRYEPPSDSYGGYEPPSYQPYQPEPEAEEEAPKPRKGMMDDDDGDDLARRSAAMQKSAADREADDAFRKAAEADAERDKAKANGGKKGWLGGWFGGKKESQDMPTVHKAKLGEENSFYYDENLKKWVNKKGGADAAAPAAAAAPPPRGPPSRAPSGMGPPSGPPSRNTSMNGLPNMAGPPPGGARPPPSMAGTPPMGPPSVPSSRSGTPAFGDGPPMPAAVAALNGSGPPSAPPSRPPTSMSNASSLDDLLGGPPGPGQRKAGGTAKNKKKGGRYVDVMQSK